ncbi:hypothetical protein QTJ16_004471 [Diplocarpon rosae]|uniref:Integral membrane protein S linking to the trans Golgi network-domain-containing protein n=1 Tax=Diplocarpon rosae TaxID=946125 RepID=A0AAD9WEQ5_9HELO|nr:hypothetical protein QTJ16_004471 [Diplocarpon rosae]
MVRRRRPPRPGALTELPPLKILSQILLLQAQYYIAGTLLILFTVLVAGRKFSLDLVFGWTSLRGDTTVGWMLGLVWLLNALISVIPILLLISRSKLVPDFAISLHVIHLLIVSVYSHSLPQNLLWWLLQISSAALMTALGLWACQWRELRPINFGGPAVQATNGIPAEEGDTAGEEEQEYARGRGRGRGRDGAGVYEMVGMKAREAS